MITANGIDISHTLFPDGTRQVWKLDEGCFVNPVYVKWVFESEDEFITLAQLKTLLDAKGLKTLLEIPYLPYARQDKEVTNFTTFAMHTFAKLLNTLNFTYVQALDVHSYVSHNLINNFSNEFPRQFIDKTIAELNPDVICYPDSGAKNKYQSLYFSPSFVYAEKIRDQITGDIVSVQLIGEVKDKSVLIVDDICDGGMTFINLSKTLYRNGAKKVYLYVTHGIFSKGRQVLLDAGIRKIFTPHGEYQ